MACLGSGSLIWDPRGFPIQRHWFDDGPLVAVQFARQSNDGRITLSMETKDGPVRGLLGDDGLSKPRSLSDSRFGEGERQRLLTIEDESIKNNL